MIGSTSIMIGPIDSFDEEVPEEYKLDDSDWDDDTPSDKWIERRMED